MSRKEKLAEEYAQNSGKSKDAFQEIKFAYYVGYAACEQDAREWIKIAEDALLEVQSRLDVVTYNAPMAEAHEIVSKARADFAKWKERGE